MREIIPALQHLADITARIQAATALGRFLVTVNDLGEFTRLTM
jgi:hypothetical protein